MRNPTTLPAAILASLSIVLAACAPEVGSKAWCEKMDEKPTGEWTVNEASEYASSCIFRSD